MTEFRTYGTPQRVGRRKQFKERKTITLVEGKSAEIETVLAPGEPMLDMIREAIDREIKRRLKAGGA